MKVAGVLRQCQAQLDLAGSVPDGVGEGLSYQTHEGETLYCRPGRVAVIQDLRFGKHGADPAPRTASGLDEGRDGPQVRQGSDLAGVGAQHGDELAHGGQGGIGRVTHRGQRAAQSFLASQGQAGGGLHLDRGEAVAHQVVELSGQAEALGRNRLGRGDADVEGLVLGDPAPGGGQQVGEYHGTDEDQAGECSDQEDGSVPAGACRRVGV